MNVKLVLFRNKEGWKGGVLSMYAKGEISNWITACLVKI